MDTIALKKIGGSLYFKLPLSYRHKFDFEPGDLFHLIPNADGSILKLIRADEESTGVKAPVEQEATVDAA
jgi:hypothetical protein